MENGQGKYQYVSLSVAALSLIVASTALWITVGEVRQERLNREASLFSMASERLDAARELKMRRERQEQEQQEPKKGRVMRAGQIPLLERMVQLEISLRGINASEVDLTSAVLSEANLMSANLSRAILTSAVLSGANLRSADLSGAILRMDMNKDFRDRFLRPQIVAVNQLIVALGGNPDDLNVQMLRNAFERAVETFLAEYTNKALPKEVLNTAISVAIDQLQASIQGGSAIPSALVRDALHTAAIHLMKVIPERPDGWFPGTDLTGANLRDADLTGEADLTGADLTGADLTGADLGDANLTGANLTGAKLTGATLTSANFTGAILNDANLTEAILTNANLTRGQLELVCGGKAPSDLPNDFPWVPKPCPEVANGEYCVGLP